MNDTVIRRRSKDGSMRLDLNKLSDFTPVEAPERLPA